MLISTRQLVLVAALAAAAPAAADTLVYSNNFEAGAGPEWTIQTTTNAANFSRFLGRFSDATGVNLQLSVPGPINPVLGNPLETGGTGGTGGSGGTGGTGGTGGSTNTGGAGGSGMPYLLMFDFYCIDSWDGFAENGDDKFKVFVNNTNYLNTAFANQHTFQHYPHEPTVGRTQLGFSSVFDDSIYRDIAIAFDPGSATELTIRFYGETMQGMPDESWGIDNVRVYYNPVPAPGAAALMAVGGIAVGLRRRR